MDIAYVAFKTIEEKFNNIEERLEKLQLENKRLSKLSKVQGEILKELYEHNKSKRRYSSK